jgi:hypothetical protein
VYFKKKNIYYVVFQYSLDLISNFYEKKKRKRKKRALLKPNPGHFGLNPCGNAHIVVTLLDC